MVTQLASAASKITPVAADILYCATWSSDAEVQRVAALADNAFQKINLTATLSPTETLAMAGCIDALIVLDHGGEVNVTNLIEDYQERGRIDYIEKVMLPSLNRLTKLVELLDDNLKDLGVPGETRAWWVRQGLDFPPGNDDTVYRHVQSTPAKPDRQSRQASWDAAAQKCGEFVEHVRGLPLALRMARKSELESRIESVATAIAAEFTADR